MEKFMLINALHTEECRIAIVEDKRLVELEVESTTGRNLRGNIYKAKISRLEPSLQAAFLDLGTERNGFLQINDIHPSYFTKKVNGRDRKIDIQEVLEPGQELVVQVVKEEREQKGATLTTYLSLPGRYLVIMPGTDRGGISRKISGEKHRTRLKKLSKELEIPAGIGIIVRTAGLDRSLSELSRDLGIQLKLWEDILMNAQSAGTPTLLYHENDLATRVMRDYFTPDIREVLIDNPETYERVRDFVARVMPRYRSRIKLFDKEQPIFATFDIEKQVEDTFNRTVKLSSGGEIVIDAMEALVAIDVNSGKATQGQSIEETAFQTNLEAAEEVARQLRLRDLGGLVVVDFIDMNDKRHRAAVERKMAECVQKDKARVEISRLSKFGLMEMSRQRLRASLDSQITISCPTCRGQGHIKNPTLVALEVLRKIQDAVIVGGVTLVKARLHSSAALILLNNKREELHSLEKDRGAKIYILADGRLRPDEYQFEMETSKDAPAKLSEPSRKSFIRSPIKQRRLRKYSRRRSELAKQKQVRSDGETEDIPPSDEENTGDGDSDETREDEATQAV